MDRNVELPVKEDAISGWCESRWKRYLDLVMATCGLLVSFPLIIAISFAIVLSSGRPILFVQRRVGRDGMEFLLFKFRTMTISRDRGVGLTRGGDSRVTAVGHLLRNSKLDELPQLINVLKGEMSLIGPRPDLKEFWDQVSPEHRRVLRLTPGITGAASLAFSREEELLAQVPASELTMFYLQRLLPEKSRLDIKYAAQATFLTDCRILLRTVCLPIAGHWSKRNK